MTQAEAMAHAEAQRLREAIMIALGSKDEMVRWCIEHKVERGISPMSPSELAWHILGVVVRPLAAKKERKKGA